MSEHRESELVGVGGLHIYWQAWLPADEARAVVVLAHGGAEHSGRYQHVAARLVDEGFAVYALDHRGHGRSAGPRALIDRLENTVSDLHSLVLRAAGAHEETPVFLLGHSVGGTVAIVYALRHQDRLRGLVLSGPLAALEAPPLFQRVAARALSVLAPRLPLIGVDASLVSRDPAVVQAYEADPLVYRGKLPARTLTELAAAIDSFPEAVRAITIPSLIMYGTADRLCPPEGSVMLAERIGAADKTLLAYDGLYHEILNEPEQGRILDDLCSWLAARVESVPASGRA